MKIAATIALALITAASSVPPVAAQTTCIGICPPLRGDYGKTYRNNPAGPSRHELFIDREYRDFLNRRYPSYGGRFRGQRYDIGIGPGAIVGGPPPAALDRGRVRQRLRYDATAHARWCRQRYISYRSTDNTFQPFDGPRRSCDSPYN
ncbi:MULTISPECIES: BA14K family protein [Sinorhizobium]|uniref:Lectin-like protein BA14k n=1 Tax=Sinorhizobium psoraleae TaxID=520838 RepID=A0ABT4KKN1_9HYPH|nr:MULTISPECIES: BA14K family protein [Sinorhizobium]MCZ4092527.1 BA14K family protein [Sinorhizobium psoraleae]MDK1386875.1 BA14K family protein [Sinorhizobium sp. 7-81]